MTFNPHDITILVFLFFLRNKIYNGMHVMTLGC